MESLLVFEFARKWLQNDDFDCDFSILLRRQIIVLVFLEQRLHKPIERMSIMDLKRNFGNKTNLNFGEILLKILNCEQISYILALNFLCEIFLEPGHLGLVLVLHLERPALKHFFKKN